ncbi:lysozyme [Acinetobacter rudis]|uniref:lysozyme n=1 Tax=Acinetobacter rudis TaxID=632955 RepID=UPI00280FBA2A|nr:lysozyme [Acinetobacter rudis]MDQ8951929.1 lysozyme [Acinetobacter rudis]
MSKTKYWVTGLAASAAFFIGLEKYEGFSPKAYLDSGKVATIGIGSTVYENGQKVKMTDKPISKERAVEISKAHVSKDEVKFRKSLEGVKLSQVEYDVYLDFAYNFGMGNWQSSSMLRQLKAGQHVQACQSLLKWKFVAKKDCSVRSNNCWGVWVRQLDRHDKCMGAQ